MDRRKFLTGTFGGAITGGLLLRTKDVPGFDVGEPLVTLAEPKVESIIDLGTMVFNHKGQPIGVVERIERTVESVDVTNFSDTQYRWAPGRTKMTIICDGFARVRYGQLER